MGRGTDTKETATEICTQAGRSWEELNCPCVSEQQPPVHACSYVCMGVHGPSSSFPLLWEAPTPSASMHSCPVIAPMLYCAEGRHQPALLLPLPGPRLVMLQSGYPRNPKGMPGPEVSSYLFCEFGLLLQGQVYQLVSHTGLLLPLGELGRVTESRDVISGQRGYWKCVCMCACACV